MVRWTGEMVRKFVENEGYKLVEVPNEGWVKNLDRIVVSCGEYEHEPYDVSWDKFQQNRRCPKCRSVKLKEYFSFNHEEICKKISELDNKYKVSEDSPRYKNSFTKLKLSCGKHEYFVSWSDFKSGTRCPKYSCLKRSEKLAFSHEYIAEKIQELDSEYSVCEDSPRYKNAFTKLKLSCGKHEYFTNWNNFRNSYRCPECFNLKRSETLAFSHKYITKKIQELDSEYFICEDSPKYENAHTKLKLYHSICENEFYVSWDSFSHGSKPCGCNTFSKNEVFLREYFKSKNIKFSEQITFDELKVERKLRYDFGIYNDDDELLFLIEYNGIQHYEPTKFGGISQEQAEENLIKTQYHDKLKNDYAKENNIPLLRIRYDEDTIFVLENYLKGLQLIEEDDIINLTKKRSDTYD